MKILNYPQLPSGTRIWVKARDDHVVWESAEVLSRMHPALVELARQAKPGLVAKLMISRSCTSDFAPGILKSWDEVFHASLPERYVLTEGIATPQRAPC